MAKNQVCEVLGERLGLQMQWCSGDEIGDCVEMQEGFRL